MEIDEFSKGLGMLVFHAGVWAPDERPSGKAPAVTKITVLGASARKASVKAAEGKETLPRAERVVAGEEVRRAARGPPAQACRAIAVPAGSRRQ